MKSLVASLLLALLATSPLLAEEGLTKERPSKGPFVKTDKGYMVPYTVTIPGTEVSFEMMPIPAGTYSMGSSADEKGHLKNESPQIQVTVEPFWMAKNEVSWAEYQVFMELYIAFKDFQGAGIRVVTDKNQIDAVTAPTELYDPSYTFELGDDPQQPAITMTQYAAKQYTKWMSGITGTQYRLPLDAEWEFACRAGSKTAYHFGDDASKLDAYAWHIGNSEEKTQFVGQKKPNQFGLHDMHGNVAEWVLDQYYEDGYKFLAGKKWNALDTFRAPTKQYPRPVRGGHWASEAEECRSASRFGSHDEDWKSEDPNIPLSPWWYTTDPARGVGFRMIRPLNELPRAEMNKLKFWEADVEETLLDVDNRIDEGRGVYGLVDKDLPAAIKKLDE